MLAQYDVLVLGATGFTGQVSFTFFTHSRTCWFSASLALQDRSSSSCVFASPCGILISSDILNIF